MDCRGWNQDPSVSSAIQGSAVSDLFFSSTNTDALHEGLRYSVFKKTGKVIGRQSDLQLHYVMRAVYLNNSRNAPDDVVAQVRALNAMVLDYAVGNVVGEMEMHSHYLQDISRMPQPPPPPQNVSNAGSRTLVLDSPGL